MRKDGIQSLGSLLSRYKSLKAPQGAVTDVFIRAVLQVCRIPLTKSQVTYKPASKTIGLSFGGPRKSEIILHKKDILRECEKELGAASAPGGIL